MESKSLRVVQSFLLFIVAVTSASASKCSRLIEGTTMPRSNAEGKYHLLITLFNRTEIVFSYMPSTRYTVTIQTDSTGMIPRKFTRFLISSEPENEGETTNSGVFDIQDEALTRYSENCPNAVIETSMVPKEAISVAWTSPSEGSGCVFIRATILETLDTWYMDDSNLVLKICQDTKAEADDQGPVLQKCCACEEAKYEVTFEGLWSRNTHPKDFPSKGWLIRFSDVIGASHTVNYRFWEYNEMASTGLRQVAEHGSTRRLESELKNQSDHIRTIIKARGISYPNVTGKTFAVFRVDRKHHLMSLVSMIDPSPDWIVGVSGLELCLSNCSWIMHKELNLYPYDAGTDSGITYLSPDAPSNPPEPIRRITSSYPEDPRSPFYDPSGLDMKPMARLYLNRQRLYEKTCDAAPEDAVSTGAPETKPRNKKACRVTSWSTWGNCSNPCGRGVQHRQRYYKDQEAAEKKKCNTPLTERAPCTGKCDRSVHQEGHQDERCAFTDWSDWSSCSTTCGPGHRVRTRKFQNKQHAKACRLKLGGSLPQQTIECNHMPCSGEDVDEVRGAENEEDENAADIDEEEEKEEAVDEEEEEEEEVVDVEEEEQDNGAREDYEAEEPAMEVTEEWLQKCPEDRYTQWSLWTPCSSSCGPGLQLRSRLITQNWSNMESIDDDSSLEECKIQQAECIANIPTCNFTKEEAEDICSEPMKKGNCSGNILRAYFDKQAGRCRLFSFSGCDGNRNNFPTEQDCKAVCGEFQKSLEFKGMQPDSQVLRSSEENIDCEVTAWSNWSKCATCRGYTTSKREVLVLPRGNGKNCPQKLFRKRKCYKIPPCSLQRDAPSRRSYRDKNTKEEEDEVSVNCKVSSWSPWSRCTATCGVGSQYRTRVVKVEPRGPRGKMCPILVDYRDCHKTKCL